MTKITGNNIKGCPALRKREDLESGHYEEISTWCGVGSHELCVIGSLLLFIVGLSTLAVIIMGYPATFLHGHVTVSIYYASWTFMGIAGIYFVYLTAWLAYDSITRNPSHYRYSVLLA